MKKPWLLDYKVPDFDVVSPELPTGSSWLINCLIELNIPIWQPWDIETVDEWSRIKPFTYQYQSKQLPWKQTLPALQTGRIFQFDKACSGRTTHRWASTVEKPKKIIFFVRDPRDLMYSQWRRNQHNIGDYKLSFEAFLQSRYHHYPITQIEYLSLYFQLWKIFFLSHDHLIIKFEDYKSSPHNTIIKVLEYIGVSRHNADISCALKASDFAVVAQIEKNMAALGTLTRKFNFASTAFEYKKHMSASVLEDLNCEFKSVINWLGYETPDKNCLAVEKKRDKTWIDKMIRCVYNGHCNVEQYESLKYLLMYHIDRNIS